MKQLFQEAINNFELLSGVEKAGFAFWSLTTIAFYVSLGVILTLILQDQFTKLKQFLKK